MPTPEGFASDFCATLTRHALLQGACHLYVPLEPLETDVDKTPSEAPMPSDINLEEMDNDSSGATPKATKPGPPNPLDRDQVFCTTLAGCSLHILDRGRTPVPLHPAKTALSRSFLTSHSLLWRTGASHCIRTSPLNSELCCVCLRSACLLKAATSKIWRLSVCCGSVQQLASPAVAIPRKGTSSHGSIGDRRQAVAGSVADSEPPLSQHTLELFNTVTTAAGSRSAPNSHRDTFDRLSVASLSSLQPKGADGSLDPEGALLHHPRSIPCLPLQLCAVCVQCSGCKCGPLGCGA